MTKASGNKYKAAAQASSQPKETSASNSHTQNELPTWLTTTINKILTTPTTKNNSNAILSMPIEITPWLYLSSQDACLLNLSHLQEILQITHVLSANAMSSQTTNEIYWTLRAQGLEYTSVEGYDVEGYDMLGKHWNTCRDVLKTVRSDYYSKNKTAVGYKGDNDDKEETTASKIVVFCQAGQNRSGLIVASALIELEGWALLQTVRHLRERRGVCLTNKSFQAQLCMLADKLGLVGEIEEKDVCVGE